MKKLNFALLAAVMALLVLPSTALAENTEHKHCVCGGHNTTDCTHTNEITWTELSATNLGTDGKLSAGNYYLTGDLNAPAGHSITITIGTVNICLNGHSIIGANDANQAAILVDSGATLNITDCSTDEVGKITHNITSSDSSATIRRGITNDGTFNLWNGSITGNYSGYGYQGGGVYNGSSSSKNAVFNMYGGSITGNFASTGGGVYMPFGTFNMYGGSITKNTANQSGGGVQTSGEFTMYGGVISGNTAKWGGGGVRNSGTFTMSGGSITNNTNTNNSEGGGVFISSSGTFTVSGNVEITGNKANEDANNVYLSSSSDSSGTITKAVIKVSGEFAKDTTGAVTARIGVTTATTPTEDSPVTISAELPNDYANAVASDNDTYEVVISSNTLLLKAKTHESHCVCGSITCDSTADPHKKGGTWTGISDLSKITADGNYYLTADVTLSSATKNGYYFGWIVNYDVVLCLNGHSIIMDSPLKDNSRTEYEVVSTILVNNDKTLTITDCRSTVGKITHKSGKTGSGIMNCGTLNLWNGNITGNRDESTNNGGGGVYNKDGTFNMYGGSITNNSTSAKGGGVNNGHAGLATSTFNLLDRKSVV